MSTATASELFQPVLEAVDAQAMNVRTMFGGDRGLVRGAAMSAGMGHPKVNGNKATWMGLMVKANNLVEAVKTGDKPVHAFTEAMSTDLFPLLFADSLDRQMYAAYQAAPQHWQRVARRAMVNDFREVKRFAGTGIRGLLSPVKELAEHERRTADIQEYKYAVQKYEAGFGVSFEMMVNDDLDAFGRLPQDLAQSALDTEDWFVTRLYAGATGPRADFYNEANDNVIASNAPLTRANLQAALTRLMQRKDERGNPIVVTAVELVVGPGLTMAANDIMNATEYVMKDAGGNETHISGNGIGANLTVTTNFWLGTVTQTNADTSWYLFANAQSSSRPAIEVGFLRGYERPALYERIPDMRRFGGGAEVAWSFDFGDNEKKVQHIMGGTFVDPRMTLGSNGTGVA
jgi:hypothetical protein